MFRKKKHWSLAVGLMGIVIQTIIDSGLVSASIALMINDRVVATSGDFNPTIQNTWLIPMLIAIACIAVTVTMARDWIERLIDRIRNELSTTQDKKGEKE